MQYAPIPAVLNRALDADAVTELEQLLARQADTQWSLVNLWSEADMVCLTGVLNAGVWRTWKLAPCASEAEAAELGAQAEALLTGMLAAAGRAGLTTEEVIARAKRLQ